MSDKESVVFLCSAVLLLLVLLDVFGIYEDFRKEDEDEPWRG